MLSSNKGNMCNNFQKYSWEQKKLLYFDVLSSEHNKCKYKRSNLHHSISVPPPAKTQKSKPFVVNRTYGLDDSGINALELKRIIVRT